LFVALTKKKRNEKTQTKYKKIIKLREIFNMGMRGKIPSKDSQLRLI